MQSRPLTETNPFCVLYTGHSFCVLVSFDDDNSLRRSLIAPAAFHPSHPLDCSYCGISLALLLDIHPEALLIHKNIPVWLLLCAACQPPTQTFLVSQVTIPEDPQSFGRDIDQDGVIDNGIVAWDELWSFLGVSTQENINTLTQSGSFNIGLDLTDRLARPELRGYMTDSSLGESLRFDGSDELIESGEVFSFEEARLARSSGGAPLLTASSQRFVWALSLFDEIFLLPLEGVQISGDLLEDRIVNGSITGFIRAEEVAMIMPAIPAVLDELSLREASLFHQNGVPIFCEGDAAGVATVCEEIGPGSFCTDRAPDGAVTGVCISINSQLRVLTEALDENRDGHYTVTLAQTTGTFTKNELSFFFDMTEFNTSPTGLFGELFTIDTNSDSNRDAMGVGIGFEAVPARKARP